MPSFDLPLMFQEHLRFEERQIWNGEHYAKTSNAWLAKMDSQSPILLELFKQVYGEPQALIWWMRWRMFFMACAELFSHKNGEEWWVAHYVFSQQSHRQ